MSPPSNFRTSCRLRVDLGTNCLSLERTQHTYLTCSYRGVTVPLVRLLIDVISLRRPGLYPSSSEVTIEKVSVRVLSFPLSISLHQCSILIHSPVITFYDLTN